MNTSGSAQLVLPSQDLAADIAFFESLGFLLQEINPADDPRIAVLAGHGMVLRIDRNCDARPGQILLYKPDIDTTTRRQAPNGTRVDLLPAPTFDDHGDTIETQHTRSIQHSGSDCKWVKGRAGMLYRDLIPSRLGGRIIASHIHIPNGGPVADSVHYHRVGFQLIYCLSGWVDVVYEDQGSPIRLTPGDCVTQPPQIRHRVLTSSDELHVLEIGAPAQHSTLIDHTMTLPTDTVKPDRLFANQLFCHYRSENAHWQNAGVGDFQFSDTGVEARSNGTAGVCIWRSCTDDARLTATHNGDVEFHYVLSGRASLSINPPDHQASNSQAHQSEDHRLSTGAAFVIPPKEMFFLSHCSKDFSWLRATLPATNITLPV